MDPRYWDSAAFLAYLRRERGRVDTCQQVLNEGDRGDFKIVTSAFTLSEVLHLKGQERIPVEHALNVREMFGRSCIVFRAVDRPIGLLSQVVVWDDNVRPKDAVHVATALRNRLEVFETYDEGLLAKGALDHEGYPRLIFRPPYVEAPELFPEVRGA